MEKKTLLLDQSGQSIAKAAGIIKNGGLVVFPTETVYGLGGSALNANAVDRIFEAKGRPSDNPLILHIADINDAKKYCYTNELFYRLAEHFMPGPLTVILKKRDIVPDNLTCGLDTVAVRIPSHPTARRLIELAEVGIAAPSANISGRPSVTSFKHALEDMNGRADAIIDGGDCEIGLESTVIKAEEDKIIILRPGKITYELLSEVCENVLIDPAVGSLLAQGEKPLSPGMKYRHYAPKAEVILLDGDQEKVRGFFVEQAKNAGVGILCHDEDLEYLKEGKILSLGSLSDPEKQAKLLFISLREFDQLGVKKVYTRLPDKNNFGLALYNRLTKAAGFAVKNV